jgi:hypothetical protein
MIIPEIQANPRSQVERNGAYVSQLMRKDRHLVLMLNFGWWLGQGEFGLGLIGLRVTRESMVLSAYSFLLQSHATLMAPANLLRERD